MAVKKGLQFTLIAASLDLLCTPFFSLCPLQAMYQQITWPLYKAYGHAFDAFKNMVQDEGAAIFKKLEDDRGSPLPTLTPSVSTGKPALVHSMLDYILLNRKATT